MDDGGEGKRHDSCSRQTDRHCALPGIGEVLVPIVAIDFLQISRASLIVVQKLGTREHLSKGI